MKTLGTEYAIYLGDTKLPMFDMRVIAYKTSTHATKFCYVNESDKDQLEALKAFILSLVFITRIQKTNYF